MYLGYVGDIVKKPEKFAKSTKLGGIAYSLIDISYLNNVFKCELCRSTYTLLLSLDTTYNDSYERTLLTLICTNPECDGYLSVKSIKSVILFQKMSEIFVQNTSVQLQDIPCLEFNKVMDVDDVLSVINSVPIDSSSCDSSIGCSTEKPVESLQEDSFKKSLYPITNDVSFIAPAAIIDVYEDDQDTSNLVEFIDDFSNIKKDESIEAYEKNEVSVVFNWVMAASPHHVMRYGLGGKPVWFNNEPNVTDNLRIVENINLLPTCKHCNGKLVFECQLHKSALYEVFDKCTNDKNSSELLSKIADTLDFNVIYIFSCKQDCNNLNNQACCTRDNYLVIQ